MRVSAVGMAASGHRRRRGSNDSWSFTSKALVLFLIVSFSWGFFVFTRVHTSSTRVKASLSAASGDGEQRKLLHNLAVGGLDGGYVMQKQAGGGDQREAKAESVKAASPISWTWNEVPQDDRFFLVFSTDCSGYQNWQSMAIFFSADEVRQPGTLVRIASGCSEAQQQEIQALYDKLHSRFQVHFTPDFKTDKKTGKSYDFYNKPFGLLDWLESSSAPPKDSIIALLDPDFIFLRPLTYKIKQDHVLYSPTITEDDLFDEVVEGKPVAQHYGIGSHWTKFKVPYIAGAESPATKVSISDAYRDFSVGPPYLVHRNDMYKIAIDWAKFVPKVFEEYPELLAEMYAYSISAAHNQLPHLRLDHYMVSNIDASGEGWPLVDKLTSRMCGDLPDLGLDQPVFLHYCQFYRVEHWGFHKRRVNENTFSCDAPLFKIPPENLEDTHWKEDPWKKTILSRRQAKRAAFSLCNLVKRINSAATKFKHMYCEPGKANMTESVVIW